MQFGWDDGNRDKCRKHGLTLAQIEYALSHDARVAPDPAHSVAEQRFIAVSRTAKGRPVFVAFCWRGAKLRPISAWLTCMHERSRVMNRTSQIPRQVPRMTTDKEAEAFLDQDLSELDMTKFQPLDWERMPKSARINMRVPQALVDALKAKAQERGIPYQRLVREAIERAV